MKNRKLQTNTMIIVHNRSFLLNLTLISNNLPNEKGKNVIIQNFTHP